MSFCAAAERGVCAKELRRTNTTHTLFVIKAANHQLILAPGFFIEKEAGAGFEPKPYLYSPWFFGFWAWAVIRGRYRCCVVLAWPAGYSVAVNSDIQCSAVDGQRTPVVDKFVAVTLAAKKNCCGAVRASTPRIVSFPASRGEMGGGEAADTRPDHDEVVRIVRCECANALHER